MIDLTYWDDEDDKPGGLEDLKSGYIETYLGHKINELYYFDEFQPVIVYGGPLGVGKTTYTVKSLAQALGTPEDPDFEGVKRLLIFKPIDFLRECYRLVLGGDKVKAIVWDDAGFWLNALDHADPFIKAVVKFFTFPRNICGSIIMTAPNPLMIIKKLRGFPDCITIKIVKRASNLDHPSRPRFATAYTQWLHPDLKRSGVKGLWRDRYYALMPDDFYAWYKPLRDQYTRIALDLMVDKLALVLEDEKDLDELEALKQKMFYGEDPDEWRNIRKMVGV